MSSHFLELGIPLWQQLTLVFILGAIIGSFLDVIITRFNTGESINGRSRCLSCGKKLVWYELVPLLSYLALRGRCGVCHSRIPMRLLVSEILLGLLFVLAFLHAFSLPVLIFNWLLISVLVVVTFYDIEHMIIPNSLVLVTTALVGFLWWFMYGPVFSWGLLVSALLAAVGSFSFYASLWGVSKGRWIGFGDAKLAVPLGFILGPAGAFSFVIYSFWVGAAISVCLIGIQKLLKRGQTRLPFLRTPVKMKSEVPFAPFMVIAFLLVYLCEANVIRFMEKLMYAPF